MFTIENRDLIEIKSIIKGIVNIINMKNKVRLKG